MLPVVAHAVMPYLFRTGTWIYGQISNLHQVRSVVFTNYTLNTDVFPLPTIYSRGSLPPLLGLADKAMFRYLRRSPYWEGSLASENTRLIHSHFGDVAYHNLAIARRLKVPHIVTFYGYDVGRLPFQEPRWKERYKCLFDEADLFLTEGGHMRQCLINLGCPPEKAVVQHLGIDLQRFTWEAKKPDLDGTIRILVAGTFREKKGIPYALEAFANIHRDFPHTRLTLIGDATANPQEIEEKRRILALLDRLNLGNAVDWRGYQSYAELIAEGQRSHLFLSPSVTASDGDTEGGAPVTILEMEALGLPIVSTRHCDIPEVVQDGKSGLLVAERDVAELTSALGSLVSAPERWEAMGQAGRSHVEAEYDVLRQATRLEEHYLRLIETSK